MKKTNLILPSIIWVLTVFFAFIFGSSDILNVSTINNSENLLALLFDGINFKWIVFLSLIFIIHGYKEYKINSYFNIFLISAVLFLMCLFLYLLFFGDIDEKTIINYALFSVFLVLSSLTCISIGEILKIIDNEASLIKSKYK